MTDVGGAHDRAEVGPDTPWPVVDLSAGPPGGAEYAELHATQRLVQDLLTGASMPPEVSADVTARLRGIARIAERHQGTEAQRHDGMRSDLPGRGHPFLPSYQVVQERSGWLRGTVTFVSFHLGGNAHQLSMDVRQRRLERFQRLRVAAAGHHVLALTSRQPFTIRFGIAAQGVAGNNTPVPDRSSRLPNTMACTVTAVPPSSDMPRLDR